MWHRIFLIAKRDYIASVFTKAFLIGLVVAPLMFGGAFFVIAIMRATQGTQERSIAIIDHTGMAAQAIIDAAQAADANNPAAAAAKQLATAHYTYEVIPPNTADPDAQRVELSNRVRRNDLFLFLDIGPDALHPGPDPERSRVAVFSSGNGVDDTSVWLVGAINAGLRRLRLEQLGVGPQEISALLGGVNIERMGLVTRDPASGRIQPPAPSNRLQGIIVPIVMLFLMMMVVMGGSAPMLSVVAEDKMQRVFEMLLPSITPFELMMGKVLASVARSLTSSTFYILGALLGLRGATLLGMVPFDLIPWFFVYMLAEVTMLSAMGAALGASTSSSRDAQSLGILMVLPVMIPAFLIAPLLQAPNGVFATVVSLIPPFTPMIMLMRQAMPAGIPAWQPWVGLAGVILSTLLMVWAAARVFRITILMQGKPPRLADLVRYAARG